MTGKTTANRGPRSLGRFFVSGGSGAPLDADSLPPLERPEVEHAVRVLRARAGDSLIGVDGRGWERPLTVVAAGRRELEVEAAGPGRRSPRPGESGAPLPSIEVAVALPRAGRLEPMLDRLTQLGVASIRPLRCTWGGPGERWPRRERLQRVLREALKQCGRPWLPELHEPIELVEWQPEEGPTAVLHPAAGERLADWAASLSAASAAPTAPVTVVVGPEGGFDARELEHLAGVGGRPLEIGPHVLRIETAAEAAAAVLGAHLARPTE